MKSEWMASVEEPELCFFKRASTNTFLGDLIPANLYRNEEGSPLASTLSGTVDMETITSL